MPRRSVLPLIIFYFGERQFRIFITGELWLPALRFHNVPRTYVGALMPEALAVARTQTVLGQFSFVIQDMHRQRIRHRYA
jgi:hypothetical protein